MKGPVLVTGATGFIGRHLVVRLLDDGYDVAALVLPDDAVPPAWDGRVDVHRGDVADANAVDRAMNGIGTVFHLAAIVLDWGDESLHEQVTVGGTRHVFGAAVRNGARAVLASSIVYYGDRLGREVCHEDLPPGRPLGPYSRSKQAQERVARQLETENGLRLSIVRPANVFGPGSIPWVHETVHLLRRGAITLIGGGEQDAGLCHVDHLVEILMAATREEALGRVYNAADDAGVTWKRYFSDLARLADARPPRSAPMTVAKPLAYAFEFLWKALPIFSRRPPITREALNLVGSSHRIPNDRARRELGFEPSVTYDQAMAGLAEYIREEL